MPKKTQTETVTLTIDGKTVTVPKGTVAVDAAKTVGIDIPVFCYHEKLGPFGCCRMCLVEVEKMPKLATACTLAVGQDMVINTESQKATKGRQGVLEFTLLNHPLDCPVCDKGGECPLQDNTFAHGPDLTRTEFTRYNRDKAVPLSPVVTIDRERCIACQRCTRYSDIVEQETALVMVNRGFQNRVQTFQDRPYETRFSGNVVDICPVGALTNTTYRFKSRIWDLDNAETLCAHCGVNCNIVVGARMNEFMRVQAKSGENSQANDAVDDGWICDKGRFGYGFVESANRILNCRNDKGEALEANDALGQAATQLKKISDEHGPKSVGFIGSPYGTNEELYLYQKLFRQQLKTNNIDFKTYKQAPGLPVDHYDVGDIETSDLVLLIASDPTEEAPVLDLRIKKSVSFFDVKLAVLNDQKTDMDKPAALSLRYNVGSEAETLSALIDALNDKKVRGLEKSAGIAPKLIKELAATIQGSEKVCVIYNPAALNGVASDTILELLQTIGGLPDKQCGAIPVAPGTNAVGALDMGAHPNFYPGGLALSEAEKIKSLWGDESPLQPGFSALEMIEKAAAGELKALVVFRANPVVDFPGGSAVMEALKNLDYLVVHDMLETETTQLANLVLASNGPGYDDGTTTNIGGRVQFRKRSLVREDHPPDWMIISRMIRSLDPEAPSYKNSFDATDEISKNVPGYEAINKKSVKGMGLPRKGFACSEVQGNGAPAAEKPENGALRLRVTNYLFAHDKILDASSPLAHQFKSSTVYLNAEDAKALGIETGGEVKVVSGDVAIDAVAEVSDRCNPGAALMPRVSDEQGLMALVKDPDAATWVQVKK